MLVLAPLITTSAGIIPVDFYCLATFFVYRSTIGKVVLGNFS